MKEVQTADPSLDVSVERLVSLFLFFFFLFFPFFLFPFSLTEKGNMATILDNSGLMVQCDKCEVWQHCECVGLEEQDIPEQYYCEQCKPENHSVVRQPHGR
ncbi:hypothetical protein BDF14DRAFT_1793284 [Spinellus fusiger]|nr:hypothetical protein BDF14DRAFT_1793284 [Spinellus fusiger]